MIDFKSKWLKHGALNTLEHAITRVADALTSIVLIWILNPEVFSRLALAQAVVAPVLLIFVSPENVIYRDYSAWRAEGGAAMAARVRALRLFAWGKGQLALVLALLLALLGGGEISYADRSFALIWAFSLALAPQLSGADREFLRLDLKLTHLNLISIYQKTVLFGGTVAVALLASDSLMGYAVAAAFSALSTAVISKMVSRRALLEMGATEQALKGYDGPSPVETIASSLQTFSFWQHLNGVTMTWTRTMDLFVMGLLPVPARSVGLFAAVVKLSNFTTALPLALGNIFSIWVGRRRAEEDPGRERKELWRYTLVIIAVNVVQAMVLVLVAPYVLEWMSHGRWSADERSDMMIWLVWVLAACAVFSSTHMLTSWLTLRYSVAHLFKWVYLPWGGLSLAIFYFGVRAGGVLVAAKLGLVMSVFFWLVLFVFYLRCIKKSQ